MDDKVALEASCNGQKANKTSKAAKKVKPTRAQQEKELEMDSRGFLIYPKAPLNGPKRIHPLARDAFTRMSQTTRLPEEGSIEDGTLVWVRSSSFLSALAQVNIFLILHIFLMTADTGESTWASLVSC
jgi:hypothetical protein